MNTKQHGEPHSSRGWCHPLGQGEGTLWETFSGSAHVSHGSRNHIMLGGFDGPYFFGNLAGIKNKGLGWDRVLIQPTPCGDLTGAKATIGTASPPSDPPSVDKVKARARRLSNQVTIAANPHRLPAVLDPKDTIAITTKNCQSEFI